MGTSYTTYIYVVYTLHTGVCVCVCVCMCVYSFSICVFPNLLKPCLYLHLNMIQLFHPLFMKT